MQADCMKCRAKREMKNNKSITTNSGGFSSCDVFMHLRNIGGVEDGKGLL